MESPDESKDRRLPNGWNLDLSETTVERIMAQCPIAFQDLED